MLDIGVIKGVISKIPYIKKVISLKKDEFFIYGKIEILFEGLEKPLSFKFQIFPQYPLKSYDSESIRFINKDLLKYNHVMKDGSICIHTVKLSQSCHHDRLVFRTVHETFDLTRLLS